MNFFKQKNPPKNPFNSLSEENTFDNSCEVDRKLMISNELKNSLNGIYPVFQPKVSLKDKKIIGAEILARYTSKDLGVVSPKEFIPIAEEHNLIAQIDLKIIEQAFIFIKKELDSNIILNDFRISFNLSLKTFNQVDLIDCLKNLLKKYNISGNYFEVEITESIFIKDINKTVQKLNYLKKLGMEISIDDFTVGHSTAQLLCLLPVDIIKFDKCLLDSLDINQSKGTIIYKNLTNLIKELDLRIVAEGVETKDQLDFLEDLKVDYVQGYYISKPLSKEVASIIFRNRTNSFSRLP
ncbi:MAG: EAL domain-containing protein [Cetobacterium sp.]